MEISLELIQAKILECNNLIAQNNEIYDLIHDHPHCSYYEDPCVTLWAISNNYYENDNREYVYERLCRNINFMNLRIKYCASVLAIMNAN